MFCDTLTLQLLSKNHLFLIFLNGVDLPPSDLDSVFNILCFFWRSPSKKAVLENGDIFWYSATRGVLSYCFTVWIFINCQFWRQLTFYIWAQTIIPKVGLTQRSMKLKLKLSLAIFCITAYKDRCYIFYTSWESNKNAVVWKLENTKHL